MALHWLGTACPQLCPVRLWRKNVSDGRHARRRWRGFRQYPGSELERSREQSSGIQQVGQAVTDMDRVTQQNAALVEQSSAATQVLQEESEKLSRLTASFKL